MKPTPSLIAITVAPVQSSQLTAAGYDPEAKVLQVDFRGSADKIFQYHGIEAATFEAFQAAESKGTFFHNEIKNVAPYNRFDRKTGELTKSWEPEAEEQKAA